MPDPLLAIESRLAQATPGPWEYNAFNNKVRQTNDPLALPVASIESAINPYNAWNVRAKDVIPSVMNGQLIAHAPTDLAYLLARLKAAETFIKSLQVIRGEISDPDEVVWITHLRQVDDHPKSESCRVCDALTTWQQAKGEG